LLNGDNSVVDATPKALEILCVLVESGGKIVSKEEIIRRVWADSIVEEANLSHHIFRLRKALGETDEHKFIETVPKRGYRFVAELKETEVKSPEPEVQNRRIGNRKILAGSAFALLLVLTGFLVYLFTRENAQTNAPETSYESIAVMPFQNESGNADIEYLSDGMTETLISSLSQIPKMNVKARSSVFRYKGKEVSTQTVGTELNVQAILNGRVVQRVDDLTLFLTLVDAKTENQIWGKQYNRKLTNLIALQTEIARDVSDNLKTKLTGADQQKLVKNYTENAEAYRLYLKGLFYWNKFTGESLKKAADYFQQAIDIDNNYALAYSGLANSYSVLGTNGHIPVKEAFPKVKSAAEKAVALDDQLPEAHMALGAFKFFQEWDFSSAEREFKRAMELDPNYAPPHELYGYLIRSQGRFDEALAEIRKAQELDPLGLIIAGDIGETLRLAGRTQEAIEEN
jgi:TolB-like protein/DNA-binding winged helix-turn-helix (wHTH) protein